MSDRPRQQNLFPEFSTFHGPKPVLKKVADIREEISFVAGEIKKLVKNHGYPLSEIAVLYGSNLSLEDGNKRLTDGIEEVFLEQGLLYSWVSEDYRAKKSYDITTETITVSTIHSAKGFDYAALFIVGLDLLDDSRWSKEEVESLTYVAITRARYRLYIPYVSKIWLIEKLEGCL